MCTSTKGTDFFVGIAFLATMNFQGKYNGFSKKFSKIHVCYAMSLVLSVITSKITLFWILNGCVVFIREPHTRMDAWTTINNKNKSVCTIYETRWWLKDASSTKIVGPELLLIL